MKVLNSGKTIKNFDDGKIAKSFGDCVRIVNPICPLDFGAPCGNYFVCAPKGPGIGTPYKVEKNKK